MFQILLAFFNDPILDSIAYMASSKAWLVHFPLVLIEVDLITLICLLVGFGLGCKTFSFFCIGRSNGYWGNGYSVASYFTSCKAHLTSLCFWFPWSQPKTCLRCVLRSNKKDKLGNSWNLPKNPQNNKVWINMWCICFQVFRSLN